MLFKAAGMAQVRRDDDTPVRAFLRAKFNDKALLMPVTNSYLHQQGQSLLKYDYSITIGIPATPKQICYTKHLASHTFDGICSLKRHIREDSGLFLHLQLSGLKILIIHSDGIRKSRQTSAIICSFKEHIRKDEGIYANLSIIFTNSIIFESLIL